MQLPPSLREAIDRELVGVSLRDLARAAEIMSQRYRAEIRDNRFHVDDALSARAYLTTRLPATYAAVARTLQATAEARPDFAPRTALDIGAGPGTATWAAAEQWPTIEEAHLVEGSGAMREVGARLAAGAAARMRWHQGLLEHASLDMPASDLVLMAYVLDELAPETRDRLVPRLWELAGDTLVIVEPGTSAGWQRILRARDRLTAAGAHILAPCPHAQACPLTAPDWCHFYARLPRSRLHREAKGGSVPWEDEKFIYLAASRRPATQHQSRVLAPPRISKAGVTLKLCQPNGTTAEYTVARREKDSFKSARKIEWGGSCTAAHPLRRT